MVASACGVPIKTLGSTSKTIMASTPTTYWEKQNRVQLWRTRWYLGLTSWFYLFSSFCSWFFLYLLLFPVARNSTPVITVAPWKYSNQQWKPVSFSFPPREVLRDMSEHYFFVAACILHCFNNISTNLIFPTMFLNTFWLSLFIFP